MIDLPDHVPELGRLKVFYALIVLMLGCIIMRLWYLQVVKGAELALQAEIQQTKTIKRLAPRGLIVDRHGRVLATSRPKYVVSVLPDNIKKNPEVLTRLAALLNIPEAELDEEVQATRYLRGSARFDPVALVRDIDIGTLSKIEEERLDLPGVLITRDPIRYYSDNGLCTHVLGISRPISKALLKSLGSQYRGGDYVGMDGLEKSYEQELRGKDGGTKIVVDAKGRMQRSLGEEPPVPGHTLKTTLDLSLQKVAADALRVQLNKGHPGTAIALDPNNGEVLAMVSMPTYDLNNYGKDFNALNKDKSFPFLNRAIRSAYPCGSPFKLITAAAGLESGTVGPNSTDDCGGSIRLGRQRFRCDEVHGTIGFFRAIGASCNIFFYHVGQRTGEKKLAEWALKFGLGKKTGIDLPKERQGTVPTPQWKRRVKRESWNPGDTLHMAIGQGDVEASPLQLANFVAALANGGTLWRPHVVREILDVADKTSQQTQPEAIGQLGLKPQNRNYIVEGMERALQRGGTAEEAAIHGLSIAGKTGTVQVPGKPNNSVFVCFAPVEHPQIAIVIMVEGGGYGSSTAAPIARSMLLQYLGKHPGTRVATARTSGH